MFRCADKPLDPRHCHSTAALSTHRSTAGLRDCSPESLTRFFVFEEIDLPLFDVLVVLGKRRREHVAAVVAADEVQIVH